MCLEEMNREELDAEILRVRNALKKTRSDKLSRDYSKYLRKLLREARDYDRFKKGFSYGSTKN